MFLLTSKFFILILPQSITYTTSSIVMLQHKQQLSRITLEQVMTCSALRIIHDYLFQSIQRILLTSKQITSRLWINITCLVSAILVAMTILCMPGGGRSNTLSWLTVGISECSGIIRNLSATQHQQTVLLAQSTIFVTQLTVIVFKCFCWLFFLSTCLLGKIKLNRTQTLTAENMFTAHQNKCFVAICKSVREWIYASHLKQQSLSAKASLKQMQLMLPIAH